MANTSSIPVYQLQVVLGNQPNDLVTTAGEGNLACVLWLTFCWDRQKV